jgi:hypothetical protein
MPSIINATVTSGLTANSDVSGNLIFQTSSNNVLTLDTNQNATFAGSVNAPNTFGFKNRIINGGMSIAQYPSGSYSGNLLGYPGGCDRWMANTSGFSTASWTAQQVSVGTGNTTTGYAQQIQITSTGSGATLTVQQRIEAINCADLNGKTITVTAIIYQNSGSSLSPTFAIYSAGSLDNWTSPTLFASTGMTSVASGVYTKISTSFTLGATTASNGLQFSISFSGLGALTSVNFRFSDVQLEQGTQSTSFDLRDYGRELIMCQRYYWRVVGASGGSGYALVGTGVGSSTQLNMTLNFPVVMRIPSPTITIAGTLSILPGGGNLTSVATAYSGYNSWWGTFNITGASLVAGQAQIVYAQNATTNYIYASAEL